MSSDTTGPQTILKCLRAEGMSDHDIKAIMPGAIPDEPQPRRYGVERSMVDNRWCVYGPRGEALCPWFLVPAMWLWVRLQ